MSSLKVRYNEVTSYDYHIYIILIIDPAATAIIALSVFRISFKACNRFPLDYIGINCNSGIF